MKNINKVIAMKENKLSVIKEDYESKLARMKKAMNGLTIEFSDCAELDLIDGLRKLRDIKIRIGALEEEIALLEALVNE